MWILNINTFIPFKFNKWAAHVILISAVPGSVAQLSGLGSPNCANRSGGERTGWLQVGIEWLSKLSMSGFLK